MKRRHLETQASPGTFLSVETGQYLVKALRILGVDAHGVAYPAGLQLSRGEPLRQELLECATVAPTSATTRMDKQEPLMPAGSKWSFGTIPPPKSQLELERKFSQGLI